MVPLMKRPEVLLIDADPTWRTLLADWLRECGFAACSADAGDWPMRRVDAILLHLPLSDGHALTLLGKVRATHKAPIVLLSSAFTRSFAESAAAQGVRLVDSMEGLSALYAALEATTSPPAAKSCSRVARVKAV